MVDHTGSVSFRRQYNEQQIKHINMKRVCGSVLQFGSRPVLGSVLLEAVYYYARLRRMSCVSFVNLVAALERLAL